MSKRGDKWIASALSGHRGRLHRRLGVPMDEVIELHELREAARRKDR